MAKPPGFGIYSPVTVSFPTAGNVVPGDLVSLDANGQVVATDAANSIGVVSDTAEGIGTAGENIDIHIGGVVVANVESGTTAGAGLGEPNTATAGHNAGEMHSGGGSEYDLLSDEGGSFKGASMQTGYGAVNLG